MRLHEHKNGIDHEPVTLGDCIRNARENRRLSARKLSAELQMHPSYISRIEAGIFRQPSPEKLQRIAKYLGLDYSSLCALAGYEMPGLPSFPAYLRLKYDMSDDDASRIVEYFELLRSQHHFVERPEEAGTESKFAA